MNEQHFRILPPQRMNMVSMVLDRWADKPDGVRRPAIYSEDEVITYRQLQGTVNRLGNFLLGNGVKPGDRVLVRMSNHPLYIALNMAIIKVGAVAVATSTLFRSRELRYILDNSGAKVAVTMPEFADAVEEVRREAKGLEKVFFVAGGKGPIEEASKDESDRLLAHDTSADDLAFILYTSGTTAFPKGVPHAHRWLVAMGEPNAAVVMCTGGGDRVMTPSEMTWMWPWGYCIWYTMYSGAATCVYSGRFDPEKTIRYMEKYGVTHFVGNPTIYRRLLRIEVGGKRPALRAAFSSGETLAPELFNEWKDRFGCEIYDCIGQTESHVFCSTRPGTVRLGSMGKPLPGIPVTVVREDGTECDENETGYLAIDKGFVGLTPGYLGLEEEWNARIRDRWYLTWDYAKVDEDGFFWYISRTDDLIKSRGYLVAPKEVEDVLQEHQAVLESAAVGLADPELRERVAAFIVLAEGRGPTEELAKEIRRHVASRVAGYKVPKEMVFVEALPKTVTGKVMRKALKEGGVVGDSYRF
ncbi:MAG: acyl-CoA synthetase [Nitrososphaerota archaeon]|nr:acyl-CoA synthetase [Nitrososphaerota archaeon]